MKPNDSIRALTIETDFETYFLNMSQNGQERRTRLRDFRGRVFHFCRGGKKIPEMVVLVPGVTGIARVTGD